MKIKTVTSFLFAGGLIISMATALADGSQCGGTHTYLCLFTKGSAR